MLMHPTTIDAVMVYLADAVCPASAVHLADVLRQRGR
jgi:hypothetical protein